MKDRSARKDKNPHPARLRLRVGGTTFLETQRREGKRNSMRSFLPRGHWRLPSRYIYEIRFCPRVLFIAVAIHWRQSRSHKSRRTCARLPVHGGLLANLHRPYCCALKSQSKFHVDPLCDWPTALYARRRGLIIAPERDRDPTRTLQEAIIASMRRHVIQIACEACRMNKGDPTPALRIHRETIWKKFTLILPRFQLRKHVFER